VTLRRRLGPLTLNTWRNIASLTMSARVKHF